MLYGEELYRLFILGEIEFFFVKLFFILCEVFFGRFGVVVF